MTNVLPSLRRGNLANVPFAQQSQVSIPTEPAKFQEWGLQAKERRKQMRVDELVGLDFHGFGGTIDGLRAFLAHKYSGGSARGWRTAIAPDDAGVKPATKMEFLQGLKRIGYAGQAMTLWKALSKRNNGYSAGLEDLEPDLAIQLDALARRWIERYERGAYEAWPDVRREHAGRATLVEFASFLDEQDLLPDELDLDLRRVFDVLAFRSCTTLTRDDLRFLDSWAARRLGVPLCEEEEDPVAEEPVRYTPPPPKSPPSNDLAAFREFLKRRFGSPARAWRQLLDVKGTGSVGISDFGTGCRQAGWKHPHAGIWRALRELGGGVVSMRALDPDTCAAIEEFISIIKTSYGDLYTFWDEVVDPGGTGTVSQKEFITDLAKELQMSAKKAHLVFMCLDTQSLGWVAANEMGFIHLCAKRQEEAEAALADTSIGALHNASSSSAFVVQNGMGQSHRSASEGALTSPLRRKAVPVSRPTRATQRTLYFSSHKLKHRWMRSGPVHDRCTHSSSQVPKTEALPWTADRDIFRSSNEFYREGMKLLASSQRKS
jgi:hypothetical protein